MKLVRHSVAVSASACLLAACGGGGDEPGLPGPASAVQASSAPSQVQIEGCVVDQHDRPHAARVHAFSDDGRLVAIATSNPQGIFRIPVPAQQSVRIKLESASDESLALLVQTNNISLGGCLRE